MSPTRAEILAFVEQQPHGVTTAQVRTALGGAIYTVSSTLSKLHAYGYIDAKPYTKPTGGRGKVWCRKQAEAAE